MHDGGCIALDWWNGSHLEAHAASTAPVVIVLHGLNGAFLSRGTACITTPGAPLSQHAIICHCFVPSIVVQAAWLPLMNLRNLVQVDQARVMSSGPATLQTSAAGAPWS
jgi:hypothetical protein